MPVTIEIVTDYPALAPLTKDLLDMAHVFSACLHLKPWTLVKAMNAKRHLCAIEDREFDAACCWVVNGDEWSIRSDMTILQFILRRSVEVLGITHEQELQINPLLREMVAYDKACAAEPYFLPNAAE